MLIRRSLLFAAANCLPLVVGSVFLFGPEKPALAAGFALREQSATNLGNAFAGATAGAEDISFMFFNPASLARHSGNQVVAVGSYLIPRISFETAEARTALGTPITGGTGGGDATPDVFIPATYTLWDVHPDWKVGMGLNVPFGLETKYDAAWAGRYHAVRSRLRTITATPTVAWRVTDFLSLGAGLQIKYADAILTNAIDFGTIGTLAGIPGAAPAQQDGFADLRADDVGVGYTLGVLVEPFPGTRIGVGYRSKVALDFTGDGRFDLDPAGIGATLSSATGAFTNTGLNVDVTTPESLSIGVYQDINEKWSVMGELAWTGWSRFNELRIRFDNPAQPDSVTEHDWRNTVFVAAGATFRPSDKWQLRAGIAFDQSPVPDRTRTPRIPDNDRFWVSFGAAYAPTANLEFSFGYTHIFVSDSTSRLEATAPGNFARGDFGGKSETSIDLLSAQVLWRF
jgi:long-chain fatty acid transport protein